MRPGQQNRRMRGRSHNGNGGSNNNNGNNNTTNSGHNNHRRVSNPLTRSYESNGPDVKVRGTAQNIAEKYLTLARDSQSAGDRVMAESYLQHAEHYNRIIAGALLAQQNQFSRDDDTNSDAMVDHSDGRFDDVEHNVPAPVQEYRPEVDEQPDVSAHQPAREMLEQSVHQHRRHVNPRLERTPIVEAVVAESVVEAESVASDDVKPALRRERLPRAPRAPRAPRTPRSTISNDLSDGTGLLATLSRGVDKPTKSSIDDE
jgi:hypothetical protein